jgi:hypothetical protein
MCNLPSTYEGMALMWGQQSLQVSRGLWGAICSVYGHPRQLAILVFFVQSTSSRGDDCCHRVRFMAPLIMIMMPTIIMLRRLQLKADTYCAFVCT